MNASCGISKLPNWRILAFPFFCFSSSLRVASPPPAFAGAGCTRGHARNSDASRRLGQQLRRQMRAGVHDFHADNAALRIVVKDDALADLLIAIRA